MPCARCDGNGARRLTCASTFVLPYLQAEAENDSSLVTCYCSGLSNQVVLLESLCLPWIEMKATALALQNAAAGARRVAAHATALVLFAVHTHRGPVLVALCCLQCPSRW